MRTGIVLSGGGARGAYQAGAIRALCEISLECGVQKPFQIITGISAGSINATYLACHAHSLRLAGAGLARLWANLSSEAIFNLQPWALGLNGLRLIKQLSLGALTKNTPVQSLLDTRPLYRLLAENMPFAQIQKNIDQGLIQALAITATSYANTYATSFVQGEYISWEKSRRISQQVMLSTEHLMASSAIPILFPAYKIGQVYYGDGGVVNTAPLSPAIRLGAEQLIVVGVRSDDTQGEMSRLSSEHPPSLARIVGLLIHGLLMDAIDVDVERLERVNQIIKMIPAENRNQFSLKPVEHIWISPSQYLGKIAGKWMSKAPYGLRFLMAGLGSAEEGEDLFSYLLFEAEYCRELIKLGYQDTMAKAEKITAMLLKSQEPSAEVS